MQTQTVVKGMVQVAGTTFRIARIGRGHYEVVRILDELRLGSFWNEPTFAVPRRLVGSLDGIRDLG